MNSLKKKLVMIDHKFKVKHTFYSTEKKTDQKVIKDNNNNKNQDLMYQIKGQMLYKMIPPVL